MIELHGVTKRYAGAHGGTCALDAADLDLPAGEFVAIVGKPGSGKSPMRYWPC